MQCTERVAINLIYQCTYDNQNYGGGGGAGAGVGAGARGGARGGAGGGAGGGM